MQKNTRPFILCADDYGFTPAVSAGVLEAVAAGAVSAASAMTNRPDWPRAAAEWRRTDPNADLGLHLNLTAGAGLTGFGGAALPALPELVKGALSFALDQAALTREIAAQIAAFLVEMGRAPDHIDGHQHVHALPGVRAALFAALAEQGLEGVPIRVSADRLARIAARGANADKALKVAGLTAGFAGAATRRGHVVNNGFAGYSNFMAGAYAKGFPTYLKAMGPRHLVMCHPGYVDDALRALDPVVETREEELRYLTSQQRRDDQEAAGAHMVRAKNLFA